MDDDDLSVKILGENAIKSIETTAYYFNALELNQANLLGRRF